MLVESLIRGGKCMWYYGNEVCCSSTLDAEAEMLDAGWKCRITKSTLRHVHAHFSIRAVELFKIFSRSVCRVEKVISAFMSQTKQSSIYPHCGFHQLCFCFIPTPAEHWSILIFSTVIILQRSSVWPCWFLELHH